MKSVSMNHKTTMQGQTSIFMQRRAKSLTTLMMCHLHRLIHRGHQVQIEATVRGPAGGSRNLKAKKAAQAQENGQT